MQRVYLKTEMIQRLAEKHRSGKAANGEMPWELINLEIRHKIFLDNQTADCQNSCRKSLS
jgi:hypothetical protein